MKKTNLLLAIFASTLAFAQWNGNTAMNTIVSNSVTSDISARGTNDGQTYVMYWDESTGANNYIAKLQLLDQNGIQKFGPDGMVVNATAPMSSFTYIGSETVDSQNNIFIAFTASGNAHGYIHKINVAGQQLLGANGIDIGENAYNIKVFPVSDGSFYAGWSGNNGANFMKYNSTGVPQWAQPVTIAPPVPGKYTDHGEAAVLSDGSILMMYHVKNVAWTIDSNFWAMRYSANGTPMWSNAVQLSDRVTFYNRSYSVKQDGDTVYLGYFGVNSSNNFDSFVQRINSDGTLPWGLNGTDFGTAGTYYEMETSIGFQPGSPNIWSVVRTSNATQSQFGTAVQKFDKVTGARLLSDAAKQVYPISNDMMVPVGQMEIADNKPLFLTSLGNDVGPSSPTELAFTYLDESGNKINNTGYIKIATAPGTNKWRVSNGKAVNGQIVGVWAETRNTSAGSRAYANPLNIQDFFLGVQDSKIKRFAIYPNPAVDFIHISSSKKLGELMIYSIDGKLLKTQKDAVSMIDVRNLSSGIYLIKAVAEDGEKFLEKFLKR